MLELVAAAIDSRRALRTIEAAQILTERFAFKVGKLGKLIEEGEIDCVGWAVALFRNDQLGNVLVLIAAVIDLFTINESNEIGVLFDGARLTQVGKLRTMVGAVFRRAGQL